MNIQNIDKAEILIAEIRAVELFQNRLSQQRLSYNTICVGYDDFLAKLNTTNPLHDENQIFAKKIISDMIASCEAHLVTLKAELALL